jgi:hypothetical protein
MLGFAPGRGIFMPRYSKQHVNASDTYDYYEKRYDKAEGWNKYMLGRQMSKFVMYLAFQQLNIHQCVEVYSGSYAVCCCGLKLPENGEFLNQYGHLYAGEVAKLIVHGSPRDGYLLYCQECKESYPIVSDGDFPFYGIPDVNLAATFKLHSVCMPRAAT